MKLIPGYGRLHRTILLNFRRLRPKHSAALPDFIIIGAQKCGTSTLTSYLWQHPQIVAAAKKEVHYFDLNYSRGIRWYERYFCRRSYLAALEQRTGRRHLTFEATPYYVYHPAAIPRIAADLPDAKLVLILRNPVDRAISHYLHEQRHGFEELPLDQALDREAERIDGEEERLREDPHYFSVPHRKFSYVSRGCYVEQIRRVLEFFPSERLHIIKSDALFENPGKELHRLFRFIGVEPWFGFKVRQKNKAHSREAIPPSIRHDLAARLAEANSGLTTLAGPEFDWFQSVASTAEPNETRVPSAQDRERRHPS